jgi:hypothetical protein
MSSDAMGDAIGWNAGLRRYDVPPQLACDFHARATLNAIAYALDHVRSSANGAVRVAAHAKLVDAAQVVIRHATSGDPDRGRRFTDTLTAQLAAGVRPGDAVVLALRASVSREVKETTPDA